MLNIRALAADILIEVLEHGEYLSKILSDVLFKYSYLEKRDRAFLTRLVSGTVERLIELDYVIDSYSKTKVKKQKPYIRNVLRMSVYQLLYMDSVPGSAAVNEAVKLVRKKGFSGLSGFANGVLRSISRDLDKIKASQNVDESASVNDISIRFSIPEWILEEYKTAIEAGMKQDILYPKDATLFSSMDSFYKRAGVISLRINTKKTGSEEFIEGLKEAGIKVMESGTEGMVSVSGVDTVESLPGFAEGHFYVQDRASAIALELADIKEGEQALDVCAAPGGKSFFAAICGAKVTSRDVSEKKTTLIQTGAERLGLSDLTAEVFDATVSDENSKDKYDIVLCDVPCSGLGVLSKKPELKYRVQPEDVHTLAEQALVIADNAATYVRPGGRLLFSTCTVSCEENMDNVSRLLEKHGDLVLKESRLILPTPHNDGFFAALLVRDK